MSISYNLSSLQIRSYHMTNKMILFSKLLHILPLLPPSPSLTHIPMADQKCSPSHILMFPLPLQGPVNSMLKLAELLCLADLHVTFLVTDHIYARLHRHSNIQNRFSSYPGFRIRSVSDGLPQDHPRADILELFDSLRKTSKPLFREMLSSDGISCVIADGMLGFTCDVANDVGVPIFYVRTISAACLWVFFCLPKLIQDGDLPFQGQ